MASIGEDDLIESTSDADQFVDIDHSRSYMDHPARAYAIKQTPRRAT